MSWFFMYQQDSSDEPWKVGLADSREEIVAKQKPMFTTALDLDHSFETPIENMDVIKFKGPLYFDFDSSDIALVIPEFLEFLGKLETEFSLDLNQVEIFLSGGKGFHVIIPEACFLPKPNHRGQVFLPYIYKEIANALYVRCLDLNVYTAKRGRQFRTANVKRPNGKYKVPVSAADAKAITPELYEQFCSAPRPAVSRTAPTLNTKLAVLYATSADKVVTVRKNRPKAGADVELLKQLDGKTPESILAVMRGDVKSKVGFHKTAIQLAISANALGMTEEAFMKACEGLVEKHVSDGARYNTKFKREVELKRAFGYHHDNPEFKFSVGGVKSLMPEGTKTPDLDRLGNQGIPDAEIETGDDKLDFTITQGIQVTSKGMFRKTDNGLIKVSDLGLLNPRKLIDVHSYDVVGYEVDVTLRGEVKPSRILPMSCFLSRQKFLQFTLAAGGVSMNGTDGHVAAIADILNHRATQSGSQVYTLGREGLDIVRLPDGAVDVVWVDQHKVYSKLGIHYRFKGTFTDSAAYGTDLVKAPALEDTPESRLYFRNLFQINKPEVLGRLFGFYFACFYTQPIRHLFGKFPLMQVYGPAGSGKTETNNLLLKLFYYQVPPVTTDVLQTTPFILDTQCSGSASIPNILDEFKPREMSKRIHDKCKGTVRGNYNGLPISKGHVGSETGQSMLTIQKAKNVAPTVMMGEALEGQTAVIHRCVMVPMNIENKRGRKAQFVHCSTDTTHLSSLGKECMERALRVNFEGLRKEVFAQQVLVDAAIGEKANDEDRSAFNIAVNLTGLEFGRKVLNEIFVDGEFNKQFETMREAILAQGASMIPRVLSEASKVLDTLAYMSRSETDEKTKLELAKDYIVEGDCVQLDMRRSHTKYARFKRSLGEEVLYDSFDAFVTAMSHYAGLRDRHCLDSCLKDSATTIVYSFPIESLIAQGVGEFYCQS